MEEATILIRIADYKGIREALQEELGSERSFERRCYILGIIGYYNDCIACLEKILYIRSHPNKFKNGMTREEENPFLTRSRRRPQEEEDDHQPKPELPGMPEIMPDNEFITRSSALNFN